MDKKQSWVKYQDGTTCYYHLKTLKKTKSVLHLEQATKDFTWLDNLSDNGNYSHLGEEHIIVYNYEDTEGGIDIPAGSYTYCDGQGYSPDRLVVGGVRKDSHFNIRPMLTEIEKDMDIFLSSGRDVYERLGIMYKRGYLVYGDPGNGKTAEIRKLINNRFKDAIIVWLKEMPSGDMLAALNASPLLKVFIMEEITDAGGDAYKISEILEFLDGEGSVSNSITIATTNYPEQLQRNLANRPSRFDVVVNVGAPLPAEAKQFFECFLQRPLLDGEVPLGEMSVAQIKEICILHLTHGITLEAAYEKMKNATKRWKKGFTPDDKKGLGI